MSDLHRFAVRNAQQAEALRRPLPATRTASVRNTSNSFTMPTRETRPEFERCQSWPLPKAETKMESIPEEEDMDQNPQQHFLSPVQPYEYQPWADDSNEDDDSGDFQWDAGITDFSLFDSDRREAESRQTELPSKWSNVVFNQKEALQRSLKRTTSHAQLTNNNNTSEAATATDITDTDSLPSLTPDTSPDLRDLGDEFPDPPPPLSHSLPFRPSPHNKQPKPAYLTVEITPPLPSEAGFPEDEDLPLSFRAPQRQLSTAKVTVQRPGLRHARTLSGKLHSWRRPGWEIYALEEAGEGE